MSISSKQRRGFATRLRHPLVLLGWLVALGCVFFFVGQRLFQNNPWLAPPFETPPFDRHIDEYAWYHYTYHYDLFFHDRTFDFEAWGADVPSIGQPNMVKFFLGAELEAHGVAINTSREKMRSWWQPFTDDETFKIYLADNLPFPDEALLVGRFYSAVFTYLAVVLSVVYVARIANLPTGVLFGFFIGHLPFLHTTRMMADSYSLCAFVLVILLFDIIATWRGSKRIQVVMVTVYSLVVGVTMGIKLTGFLALGFLPLYLLCRCLKPSTEGDCFEGLLLALYHVLLATATFVVFHPQTHGNPVLGIARFFAHQLPATAPAEVGLLGTVGSEIGYQVGVLVDTFQAMMRFDWFSVVLVGLFAFLIALGLASLVAPRPTPSTPLRFLPLVLVIISFSTVLSHELDERYTWLLTFVLSMIVFFGGDFFVRCVAMMLGRPATTQGAEVAGSSGDGEGR